MVGWDTKLTRQWGLIPLCPVRCLRVTMTSVRRKATDRNMQNNMTPNLGLVRIRPTMVYS